MPNWLEVVILGIIEGITEFLPISSTGHLLLAQQWLTPQSDLFNIVIQSGAVIAVIAVFKERVVELLGTLKERATRDYIAKMMVSFVITAVGGLTLDKLNFELPETALPIGVALLVGGIAFVIIERRKDAGLGSDEITWSIAVWMGLGQLIAAVFPGTSRSGATIVIALLLGLSRKKSVEYTFLLGVPTILAASGYKILSAFKDGEVGGEDWGMVALGTVVSCVVGFLAVKWLLGFLRSRTFEGFGWYRIILGIGVLIFCL